jgi:nicotinamidase-related amidase
MSDLMKKLYFTEKTIDNLSQELLTNLGDVRKKKNVQFSLLNTALLVLDMQNYFLDVVSHAFIPSAKAIIPRIQKLIDFFSKHKSSIIFTRHINTEENAKMMAVWWNDLLLEMNPLSEIISEFDLSKGKIIKKTQYDAFYQTGLDRYLKKINVKQLVITGVMTHLCCETTIRSAFVKGYSVLFPIDGTATYNEKFHLSSFYNLSHGFVSPILVDDLIEQLEN